MYLTPLGSVKVADEEHVVELPNDLIDSGKHGNVARALGEGRDAQHGRVRCTVPEERRGLDIH